MTTALPPPTAKTVKPRLLIIGAGSRGQAYARAALDSGLAVVSCVAEPNAHKRRTFGAKYIWGSGNPKTHTDYCSWQDFIVAETQRRQKKAQVNESQDGFDDNGGIDAVFVCVSDRQHVEVLLALAPLHLHVMSEKPLATTLQDCLKIQHALQSQPVERVFAIGHVLRYSPHNMLLRHLVREQNIIGEILSIEHTEPVGWWHFSHSYVRGNWRKESTSAPSLLTKCCHDIDFLLWMLCSPSDPTDISDKSKPHLPARIISMGSLKQFRKAQKPRAAGSATNCLSCPIESTCQYSAWKIYHERHLAKGITIWPVDIVNPDLESILTMSGAEAAEKVLLQTLSEDYEAKTTSISDIEDRAWYGRCVWESDNDVCDDQFVTIEWDDDEGDKSSPANHNNPDQSSTQQRGPKTASLHMIAQTLSQCERRGRIYGTKGEISYDSKTITLHRFNPSPSPFSSSSSPAEQETELFHPHIPTNSHHGGGDAGLTKQFLRAVISVEKGEMSVDAAQREFLGCSLEEVIRSHAVVFAAEEARRCRKAVDFGGWWEENGSVVLGG
jgi:predicted dehydrogenase